MGTEVAVSFSTLRAQLENEKSSLYKIDENIKKIVQTSNRFSNDRFNSSADYSRGGPRAGGRNSYPDSKNDDLFGKRKHETKTVFSRLSARTQDSDNEEEPAGYLQKRARTCPRMSSAVSRELPTRAAVVRAQGGGDAVARTRNKRIFGALLGTLHKFKQEEIVLQTKEDKKAQVERKIEEQARLEKEREQKERKTLFAEREHKKATIKALEAKMARVQEFERWEASQKCLANFILTKAKPHVYWLPKKMTEKAQEKLNSSRKFHEKCMTKKRQELQDELQRIEQRCLRPRGPAAKENDPQDTNDHEAEKTNSNGKESESNETPVKPEDDKGRKRDKFAMDADDKEDSDGDDRHDEAKTDDLEVKDETVKETDESIMDTSEEQNSAMVAEETKDNDTSVEDKDMEPKETETIATETETIATETETIATETETITTETETITTETETVTTESTENQEFPVEPQTTNVVENAENNEHS